MTAIPVGCKALKIGNRSRSQGIQMNVSDQFLKIGVFLAQHGLETILKQGAVAEMAASDFHLLPCWSALKKSIFLGMSPEIRLIGLKALKLSGLKS